MIRTWPPTILALLIGLSGCGEQATETSRRGSERGEGTPAVEPTESAWRNVTGSPQVVVPADAPIPGLSAAMKKARETAADARGRWHSSSPTDRARWSVKWSAATAAGGVEYLWVEPINWSPFRVEGRLANPPRQELVAGKTLDDIVSFPIEELADWMYAGVAGREGGFTLDVLEGAFGPLDGKTEPTETAAP